MKKNFLCILIVTIMLVVCHLNSFAIETVSNVNYEQNGEILYISGSGEISKEETEAYSEVEEIVIEGNVTRINPYAFKEFANLKSVTICSSVEKIGTLAFYNCAALESVVFEGGESNQLCIIGDSAFWKCSALSDIIIPQNVQIIEDGAFAECTSIKTIHLGSVVTRIGAGAFSGCLNLQKVVINSQYQLSMGAGAFVNCISLNKLVLSAAIKEIDISVWALWDIDRWYSKKIMIYYGGESGELNITNVNGYDTERERLYECRGFNYCLEKEEFSNFLFWWKKPTVSESGIVAYHCTCGSMKQIEIPALNDTSLWQYTHKEPTCMENGYDLYTSEYGEFRMEVPKTNIHTFGEAEIIINSDASTEYHYICSSCGEKKIEIEEGFEYVYSDSSCSSLMIVGIKDVAVEGILKIPEEIDGYPVVGIYSLPIMDNITSIEIPDTVTKITAGVFQNQTNLEYIKLSKNLTSISDNMFENCTALKNIVLPAKTEYIGKQAFKQCITLESIVFPDTVTYIDDEAFYGCKNLKDVVFGESLTEIYAYAFAYCTSLENLVLPSSLEQLEDCAFTGCENLTELNLPDNLQYIGFSFLANTNIRQLTLPSSIKKTSYALGAVFHGCYSLEKVFIGNNEFYSSDEAGVLYTKDKTELLYYPAGRKVDFYEIPDGTVKIGNYAFGTETYPESENIYAHSLTTIILPKTIKEIGSGAFVCCPNINTIYFNGFLSEYNDITIAEYGNSVLESATVISNCNYDWELDELGNLIIIGSGAMQDYEVTSDIPWYSGRLNIDKIIISDGITHIGAKAFYGCINATSIEIPESVISIGENAFKNCDEISISGANGSYAHQYAVANNIPFVGYSEPLSDLTVEFAETSSRWYFDISKDTYTENAIIYVGIYDEYDKLLTVGLGNMVENDITSIPILKVDNYSYAKVFEWVNNEPITNSKVISLE